MKSSLLALMLMITCLACSTKKNGTESIPEQQTEMQHIDLFEQITYEDRIQVELKSTVKPKSFEKSFEDYSLNLLNQTSRSKTQFHFSFDPNKIDLQNLITIIAEHPDVIKVESISYTSKKKK